MGIYNNNSLSNLISETNLHTESRSDIENNKNKHNDSAYSKYVLLVEICFFNHNGHKEYTRFTR
jgi:hypothetical protein